MKLMYYICREIAKSVAAAAGKQESRKPVSLGRISACQNTPVDPSRCLPSAARIELNEALNKEIGLREVAKSYFITSPYIARALR